MIQALVAPGKHSVIVHDPGSGSWYCSQVLVDAFRGQFSLDPSLEVPKLLAATDAPPELTLPRPSDFDLGQERLKILDFLEDMKPQRFITEQNVDLKSMQELYGKYDKINALFESLAAKASSSHTDKPPEVDQLQAAVDPGNDGATAQPAEAEATSGSSSQAEHDSQEPKSSKNDPATSPRGPRQLSLPAHTAIPVSQVTKHFNCTDAKRELHQEFGSHLNR